MIDTNKIFTVDDIFPHWLQIHIERKASTIPWEWRERVHSPTYTESVLAYNHHKEGTDPLGLLNLIHDALTIDIIPKTIPNINITGFFGMKWNGTIKGYIPCVHSDNYDPSHENESQWTVIYFVNDSDGDLLFFDDDQTTEIARCVYKKGRACIFPSNIYHRATDPTKNNLRITLAAQYYMHQGPSGINQIHD